MTSRSRAGSRLPLPRRLEVRRASDGFAGSFDELTESILMTSRCQQPTAKIATDASDAHMLFAKLGLTGHWRRAGNLRRWKAIPLDGHAAPTPTTGEDI